MLQSTKIKLRIEKERNNIDKERNQIEKDLAKAKQAHYDFEHDTRNRVDISLKEYEELKQKLKDAEDARDHYKNVSYKILRPFMRMKIEEEIIQKIIDDEFDCEIRELDGFGMDPLDKRIAVIYKLRIKR